MTFSNFSFLESEFPILFNIGQASEFNLHQDPVTSLFKLRQFGERLTEFLFEEHHLNFLCDKELKEYVLEKSEGLMAGEEAGYQVLEPKHKPVG